MKQRKPKFNQRYKGLECRVYLVRENPCQEPIKIGGPGDIHELVKEEMGSLDREIMLSVLVNTKNQLIGVETVFIGNLYSCVVTTREIFKSAILANAAAIVICHNHVSGNLDPSKEDLEMTKKLSDAAELLGIKLLDHMIVSENGFRSVIHENKGG